MQYAVQIPFGDPEIESTWLYVTEPCDITFGELNVVTYDTIEAAEKAAAIWKFNRVVEYHES